MARAAYIIGSDACIPWTAYAGHRRHGTLNIQVCLPIHTRVNVRPNTNRDPRAAAARVSRRGRLVVLGLGLVVSALLALASPAGASPAEGDTRVDLDVLPAIAWAPGLTKGATRLTMPQLRNAGQQVTVGSTGWHISSTWPYGYDVLISSTSDPAMAGRNATDGDGSPSAFRNFTIGGCPCPWDIRSFTQGVFGYSVNGTNGLVDAATWGSPSNRKWRGLTKGKYRIGRTGGVGEFGMDLHFRSGISNDGTQEAGSYRANVIVSISPTL